jgi:hypothetical protein
VTAVQIIPILTLDGRFIGNIVNTLQQPTVSGTADALPFRDRTGRTGEALSPPVGLPGAFSSSHHAAEVSDV